jgi:hypothetical protein
VEADPKVAESDESIANSLGYRVMGRDTGSAIEVLRLVATIFPDSSNAHDSLGEAYMVAATSRTRSQSTSRWSARSTQILRCR